MFDRLTESFSTLFRKFTGQAALSEAAVREALAEVRASLLEADVHVAVVDEFCAGVLADAVGREVTKGLTPAQELVGIVHGRLVELLGGVRQGDASPIMPVSPGPAVVMMCGLQGSGKTTTCAKLAGYLAKRGRSVMLAALDLQRPAAIEQLRVLGEQVGREHAGAAKVLFFGREDRTAAYGKAVGVAVEVAREALAQAKKEGVDTLILDTAGRLHVDAALMDELRGVQRATQPHHVFLVVDAMSGQDALVSAKAFHDALQVDGAVLTKFDSDTRGGAALSVRKVTGAPIVFVGVGEKIAALDEFHADRFAGRILGMGDVVSLVERAKEQVSEEEALAMQAKAAKGQMTLDDFVGQLRSLRKMGPFKQLLGLLPGVGSMIKDVNIDEKELDHLEAIVSSMTKAERAEPRVITHSRRKRIAAGSGTSVDSVSKLVKQFEQMTQVTKRLAGMGMFGKMGELKRIAAEGDAGAAPAPGGMGMPGLPGGIPGLPGFGRKGSSFTASPKSKFKKRK